LTGVRVLRLDVPKIAVMAALGLGGCFGSRESFIGPKESLKLFGERGAAERVHIGDLYGPPEHIEFLWTGDGYAMFDAAGRREPVSYRITTLRDSWLMTQRLERGVSVYGLARRDGDRLWTYSPECRDLSDKDRATLGLRMEANGTCWVSSAQQLKSAMQIIIPKRIKADGYYELETAATAMRK
jgi:hypothetical protein